MSSRPRDFQSRQHQRVGHGVHLDRLGAAGQEAQHVEIVDQRFAKDRARRSTLLGLVEARVAGQRPQQLDAAQLASVDQFAGAGEGAIEAALEADLERDARLARGLDGAIGVGESVGDRLFAEDGFAGLRGGDDGLGVVAGRGGDDDRFDGRIGQQLLVVECPASAAQRGGVAFGQRRAAGSARPTRRAPGMRWARLWAW